MHQIILPVTKHQSAFINAKTRGRIYLGSIGSGKTRVMCMSAIKDCLEGKNVAIISFNYRNLKDVVMRTLREVATQMELPYSDNKSDMTFTLFGRPILLRSADNHDKLRSYNLSKVYLEEAREMTNEVFEILLGRLREGEDASWALVSTTKGKNWFFDLIKKQHLEYIFEDGNHIAFNDKLTVIRSTIDDSPFLPNAYIEELKQTYTTTWAKQELYAKIIEMSGNIINPSWFQIMSLDKPLRGIRYWDLAVTTKNESDFSAGCLMSKNKSNKYEIYDISKVKLAYPELKQLILNTIISDGDGITTVIETAGQQKFLFDDLRREPMVANYVIKEHRPTKDKITRSYPLASQSEAGNVLVNQSHWNKDFFDECSRFSVENIGKEHDDQIDAVTGAFELINKNSSVICTNW